MRDGIGNNIDLVISRSKYAYLINIRDLINPRCPRWNMLRNDTICDDLVQ